MAGIIRLPQFLESDTPREQAAKLNQMVRDLEIVIEQATTSAGRGPFSLTNMGTQRRTLDFASGTATEVREFLATLADALKERGMLR